MPKSSIEMKSAPREAKLTQEASKSRIIEAVRGHILEDLGADDLNAITFGLGFSLDVDW